MAYSWFTWDRKFVILCPVNQQLRQMSRICVRPVRKYLRPSSGLQVRFRLNSTVESSNVAATTSQPKEKLTSRWVTFWKMLVNDYKIAFVDITKSMKENPTKTLIWSSIIGFSTACCITNPDEVDYRDNLVRKLNMLIFVAEPTRNPALMNYLEMTEWLLNCNEIRRVNFGLFCVLVRDSKSKQIALYRDNCPYLKPSFIEILEDHLIDFGFWNRWWMLERMMVDYDINPEEWK